MTILEEPVREKNMRFDYFYGKESDMMSFYRVPKLLITDPYFEDLDNEAKLMYGLLLDRMSLSAKNGWYDKERRVYIIYGQKKLMEAMHRGRNKVSDMLNALEKIGLIEREKDKRYNPDKIYVKMFVDQASERRPRNNAVSEIQTPPRQNNIIRITGPSSAGSEMAENDMPEEETLEIIDDRTVFENQTYEDDSMFEIQTCGNVPCTDFKHDMFADQTCACPENKHAGVWNSNTNYTEINKTNNIYTESHLVRETDGAGTEQERACREYVRENAYTEVLCERFPDDAGKIRGIEDLIVDVLTSTKDRMIVGGEERDTNVVKGRFMKLTMSQIEDVLGSINRLTEVPKNPRQYILAMLYNVSSTSDARVQVQVNHDMRYGFGKTDEEIEDYDEIREG